VDEDSENKQNSKLESVKLIERMKKQEKIDIYDDLNKVILGDFCITPTCKKCPSNAREREHKKNRSNKTFCK
jgi:hypothetical protein